MENYYVVNIPLINERLEELAKEKGTTLKRLLEKNNISYDKLQNAREKDDAKASTLITLSHMLDVEIQDLFI